MLYIILALFFMWKAFPIVALSFILYYFIVRMRTGKFLNPFITFDLLIPFIVPIVWEVVGRYLSIDGKSLSNLMELFLLGVLWGVSLSVRFLLICVCKRKNERVFFWCNIGVIICAIFSAIFVPALPE